MEKVFNITPYLPVFLRYLLGTRTIHGNTSKILRSNSTVLQGEEDFIQASLVALAAASYELS